MYRIAFVVQIHLADLHCPKCGVGLDVENFNGYEHWEEGIGACPKCDTEFEVHRSITTHYYPRLING